MRVIFEDSQWLIQIDSTGDLSILKKEYHATTTRPGPEIHINGRRTDGMVVTAESCRLAPHLNHIHNPGFLVTM
ncbi:MAG: hypothetical protein KBC81_00550 [Candidatus Pacebacteria bacterium]|nr:hypothetical protein [Candidatus Paceibacterota bacterium]